MSVLHDNMEQILLYSLQKNSYICNSTKNDVQKQTNL